MKKTNWGIAILFLCCSLGFCDEVPAHKWTFKYEAPKQVFALGLVKKNGAQAVPVDQSFKLANVAIPADFDLSTVVPLSPVLNQGNCGSCVYHSVTANFADSWLLRKQAFGPLNLMSVESLMTNPNDEGGGCNGSSFMDTAPATASGLALASDCPYNYGRNGCSKSVALHGPTQSVKLIDNSPKSIATALVGLYPVSNTVGVNNNFQGYQSGVFNACANVGTNHETEIVGFSCETAKDANGNCVFDANGNLPPGVGYWKIRNSWGASWGENGYYRIKMTDARGNLCNGVADEVGIIETGVQPPAPPAPVPPAPAPFNWSAVKIIAEIVGSLAGIAALVIVLVRK